MVLFVASGCTSSLAKLNDEEYVYDVRDDFDPYLLLSDVKEGTNVDYEINETESKVILTLSNEDKTQTLEKDIVLQYPLGTLTQENIDYYTFREFDALDYIELTEGTECKAEVNIDKAEVKHVFENGNREETMLLL